MKRFKQYVGRLFQFDSKGSIGIGSLIIFIAMILVAGIAASIVIQTMNSLQQQAMFTGEEVVKDVSSGFKVTHVSGYSNGSKITNLAIFITLSSGSDQINLTYMDLILSNTLTQVFLKCNHTLIKSNISNCYSNSISNGLFGTLNSSNLDSTTYGIMTIRDIDNTCSSSQLTMNSDDLVVVLVNTTNCFLGIDTRTKISGNVMPDKGISGIIDFTTPNAYINTIIDLQ